MLRNEENPTTYCKLQFKKDYSFIQLLRIIFKYLAWSGYKYIKRFCMLMKFFVHDSMRLALVFSVHHRSVQ